jgi:hypothetical protein
VHDDAVDRVRLAGQVVVDQDYGAGLGLRIAQDGAREQFRRLWRKLSRDVYWTFKRPFGRVWPIGSGRAAATAIAVWGGAAGCVGLILRKRWALPLLLASLTGLVVQDFGVFVLSEAATKAGPMVLVLQAMVLLIAIGLVLLARKARARGWIA